MTFKSRDANVGTQITIEVDSIKYTISTTDNIVYDSFARVLVHDHLTNERTYSDGTYEAHGRRFLFMWDKEYDATRNNWIPTRDLLIEVL